MNNLLKNLEPISGINYLNWAFGAFLLLLISELFSMFFGKFGTTVSNRKFFASSFFLFAFSIYIIVTTIKTSLSLSLGLVGALSILRFRTAIKEPEQIFYLLALTGVALSLAAEQFIISLVFAFVFLVYVRYRFSKLENSVDTHTDYIVLDFQSDELKITEVIDKIISCEYVSAIMGIDNYEEGSYRIVIKSNYADSKVLRLKQELKNIDHSLVFNSFNLTASIQ